MKCLIAVLLIIIGSNAYAADCTQGSTPDIAKCLDAKGVVLVKQLTAAYKSALAYAVKSDMHPPGAPELKKVLADSQALWWKYRDAECAARQAQYWGGTGATAVFLQCMNDLTARRIEELNTNWKDDQ